MNYKDIKISPYKVPKDYFEAHYTDFEKNYKGTYKTPYGMEIAAECVRAFEILYGWGTLPYETKRDNKPAKAKDSGKSKHGWRQDNRGKSELGAD